MWERPQIGLLPDGKRLSMRHGPIDLIVEANGSTEEVTRAYRQAAKAFGPVLETLSAELPSLRAPLSDRVSLRCSIARSMKNAAQHCCGQSFATPMIAVAGAVADYVLDAMCRGRTLRRAYVNNGGDIALYLATGDSFDVGLCPNPETGNIAARARIAAEDGIRGIATSGWRGRSHSLGIADAVTVLAERAALADAAATIIANAIDLPGHTAITRAPANTLSPDSDLGARRVTTGVGVLTRSEIRRALALGEAEARKLVADGKIIAAHATLGPHTFCAERAPACLTS